MSHLEYEGENETTYYTFPKVCCCAADACLALMPLRCSSRLIGDDAAFAQGLIKLLPVSDSDWRFETCAIVGNSGVILLKDSGAVSACWHPCCCLHAVATCGCVNQTIGSYKFLLVGSAVPCCEEIDPFVQEIDRHDAVFRINLAPIRGFGKWVGTKTTFNIVNAHNVKEMLLGRDKNQYIAQAGACQQAAAILCCSF